MVHYSSITEDIEAEGVEDSRKDGPGRECVTAYDTENKFEKKSAKVIMPL